MNKFTFWALIFLLSPMYLLSQVLKGTVTEANGDPIIGANVVIVGTTLGTTTNAEGDFSLDTRSTALPFNVQVSFIGYRAKNVLVSNVNQPISVELEEDQEMLEEVDIIEQRLSEKQRESALTVEALDALAIKETPAANFYEALGNLKGVDLTSASIGFKVINTRGFNSTSPVRSLQVIDGVDNQAPGLNFSLGNFLGASELDISNVDIIAGASTAFYGPGAFNGVISMTTKDPFLYQGISASVKVGERNLTETAVRYAEAFTLGKADYENFAFKLNLFYLRADDWEATNFNPIDGSEVPADNPGGFDAVNIYGDEDLGDVLNNDYRNASAALGGFAGLGKVYRDGYREEDLVNYDTRNFKGNLGLYYKLKEDVTLSYTFNYGTGTTVYQGENRFSLNDINFFQNVLRMEKKDKWFLQAYSTNEDAGNTYDAVLTAFRINEAQANNGAWYSAYGNNWSRVPGTQTRYGQMTLELTGRPTDYPNLSVQEWYEGPLQDSLIKYNGQISQWHSEVRSIVNNTSFNRIEAGTAEFDSLLNFVTSRTFVEGGTRFYDRSALYHLAGEYKFEPSWADIRVGGNFRLYAPNSRGNIFDELVLDVSLDSSGRNVIDTSFRTITNMEYGVYVGVDRKFMDDLLKISATVRVDKNENFDYLISPAFSIVYDIDPENTVRFSFGSAIRNPTLQDQYLRYNVGRAILLGNINGFDSLVTLESFDEYRNDVNLDRDLLDYQNVAPVVPERVVTAEIGYRATLFKRMYLDAGYYYSWYSNFIGFQFGIDLFFPNSTNLFQSAQPYRIAANAQDLVTTQGFNLGLNYYLTDKLSLSGNYSFNRLDLRGSDDPIVPAYNTPENKFNLGVTGRGYKLFGHKKNRFGFAATYKWVQGFRFEGSPQFTGEIPSYGLVDTQVSYTIPDIYSTFKLGASNLLNNQVFQVYGGPTVGRLAYFSVVFEKF
jgi:outer membrane receptor protein involved in Fe transport